MFTPFVSEDMLNIINYFKQSLTINNNEEVLRKGDEIIFNHEGETYSSKVYAINGDDIKVKYRRQNITIKSSDIKKIY